MKIWNCLYLGNKLKYDSEIWYLEVTYDADFVCYWNFDQLSKLIEFDDVTILKTEIAYILVTN